MRWSDRSQARGHSRSSAWEQRNPLGWWSVELEWSVVGTAPPLLSAGAVRLVAATQQPGTKAARTAPPLLSAGVVRLAAATQPPGTKAARTAPPLLSAGAVRLVAATQPPVLKAAHTAPA